MATIHGIWNQCFIQGGNGGYVRTKECPHDGRCSLKSCPNFLVCAGREPIDVMNEGGRCYQCEIGFGKNLEFRVTATSERCHECKKPSNWFVQFHDCHHEACISCFKEIYGMFDPPKIELSENGDYYWENEELQGYFEEMRENELDFDSKYYEEFCEEISPEARTILIRAESELMPQLASQMPKAYGEALKIIFCRFIVDTQRHWWDPEGDDRVWGICPSCS